MASDAQKLRDFFVGIGFRVDEASQRRADQAVDETEKKATKTAVAESEKRSRIEAKEADKKAKAETKEQKTREQGIAKEAKERERARRAAETAEKREHARRLQQMKELEKGAIHTADVVAGLGTFLSTKRFVQDIARTADAYSRLGLQAQRTGSSPSKIAALVYGLGQLGVDRDDANSSFNNFAKTLQNEPGLRNILASKGVKTQNADGTNADPGETFASLGNFFKSLPPNVALERAGHFGISQDVMIAVQKQEQLKAKIAEGANIQGIFHLDPKQASEDGRAYAAAYDKLAADLIAVHDKIESQFFTPVTWAMKNTSELLEAGGKGTVAFGDAFVALGALLSLRAIPPVLRLARVLAGLVGITMPAWLLSLLGIGGVAAVSKFAGDAAKGVFDKSFNAVSPSANAPGVEDNQSMGPLERLKRVYRAGKRLLTGQGYKSEGVPLSGNDALRARGVKAEGKGQPGGWWTPDRQKYAYDKLVAGGMPPVSAIALVSRWKNVESHNRGPNDYNPKSGAYGIMQGLGRRTPASANLDDQLNQVLQEYKTGSGDGAYVKASTALANAKTDQDGAVAASAYERAEGYTRNRDGTDNFTGATLGGMPEVRRNVVRPAAPLATAPNPYGALVPFVPGNVPGQVQGQKGGGYMSLGLGPDGKPMTLAPSSTNIRGDSSFHQHNTFNVHGDHRTAVAVADTVKATARRGGKDYIRFMEGSGQA